MLKRLQAGETVTLRPLFARVAGTAYLASALGVIPAFAALYALTIASGTWPSVVAVNVVVVAALYVGITQMRSAMVTFSSERIREVGYFGRVVVTPCSELAKICVVEVYSGRSLDTHTEVFFLDADGRTRLRLRGQFWGGKMLGLALDAYSLPVDRIAEPIARTELRHRYRANLYFYERFPTLTYGLEGIVLLVICTPLVAAINSAV